jgi:hypothetical protein
MTIKTQNGKVITKDGKVSCECCEECCLYPAQALTDGLYTYEDLPDTILYRPPTSTAYPTLNFIELIKEEDPQPSEFGNLDMVYYKGSFVAAGGNQSGDTIPVEFGFFDIDWAVNVLYESLDFKSFLQCLISERFIDDVKDQFADAYTVSGPISGTVTRESICVWRGSNLRLTNFGYQWKVNGNNKTGNQNTPVGSYAGGYSVS